MASNMSGGALATHEPMDDSSEPSPLDFSKRTVATSATGACKEAPSQPFKRPSLLSDVLRSPPRPSECAPTTGSTCGILKHAAGLETSPVTDGRGPPSATRTHFIEPQKPSRAARNSAVQASTSSMTRCSSDCTDTRRPSVSFLEPRIRAKSTSPRPKPNTQTELFNKAVFHDEDAEDLGQWPSTDTPPCGGACFKASSDGEEEEDENDSTGEEEDEVSESNGEEDEEGDFDANGSLDEDEDDVPVTSALCLGRSPRIASSHAHPPSLDELSKRRTLSFSDLPQPRQEPLPDSAPRRRSLAFASSPLELQERNKLQNRQHRHGHGRRRMVPSSTRSSTSSLATNLFDTTWSSASGGSSNQSTEARTSAEDEGHDRGRLLVRSPHLVKTRLPSPKPLGQDLDESESSDDDNDIDETSINDGETDEDVEKAEAEDEDTDLESVHEETANDSTCRSTSDASDNTSATDPCAIWASQSTDCDREGAPNLPPQRDAPEPYPLRPRRRRQPRLRRGSVLQSLLLTEPTMQYAGSHREQLDSTDELALAAELMLLHKSPELEPEPDVSLPTPPLPLSSDEGADSDESPDCEFSLPRPGSGSRAVGSAGSSLSQRSSGFTSPQSLSFRREREAHGQYRITSHSGCNLQSGWVTPNSEKHRMSGKNTRGSGIRFPLHPMSPKEVAPTQSSPLMMSSPPSPKSH